MDILNSIISSLQLGDSATMWVLFIIASLRGLCATATELLPDRILGPLAPIINVIGGNNLNAAGSQ